jgi:predicted CXXCH cytochrome family protein
MRSGWLLGWSAALLVAGSATGVAAQGRVAEAEQAYRTDVHAAAKLTCQSCHTAGTGTAPGTAYPPIPRTSVPLMCTKCHSDAAYMRQFDPQVRVDQYAQYLTSAHGKAIVKGETRVAVCSDCHGAHGIVRVRDPRSPVAPLNAAKTCARCHADAERMKAFGKEATPFADWSTSVHATALLKRGDTSAPTCNTCHGSHGATPPGVTQIASVCAQCHVREAELFNAGPKKKIFDDMGQAECLVCHSNHAIHLPSDALIGLDEKAVCATCHDASTNSAKTITAFRESLDGLSARLESAHAIVDRAEQAGMLVDDARRALQEAHEQQIQSRVLIHAFAPTPFAETAAKGREAAERAHHGGESALEELHMRRRGLGVATLVITGFLITLWWKIRRLSSDRGDVNTAG